MSFRLPGLFSLVIHSNEMCAADGSLLYFFLVTHSSSPSPLRGFLHKIFILNITTHRHDKENFQM